MSADDMDLTDTIIPRSDQLNAEDLLTGPLTVTITAVRRGNADQPIDIVLAEFGDKRPFKPSKTVRRILVAAWGKDGNAYVGRRMTIYRDPTVRFGGQDVGGIRVSHLSHIDKRLTLALTVTRGRRAPYVVEPLKDETPQQPPLPANLADKIAASDDLEWLRKTRAYLDKYRASEPDRVVALKGAIDTRTEQLTAPAPQDVPHDGLDEFAKEAGQ